MRAVFWVFFIALLLYGAVWLLRDDIRNWFFPNIVWVKTYEDAQLNNVRIDWTAEGRKDTLTIFDQGKQLEEEFNASGYNTFLLYYRKKLVATFDQFKSDRVGGHQYQFMLWEKQDSIQTDLKIVGPEAPL